MKNRIFYLKAIMKYPATQDSLISFKNIIVTTAACPDLPIELDFIKVLGRTIGYGKSNQTLELKDLSGRTIALFSVK